MSKSHQTLLLFLPNHGDENHKRVHPTKIYNKFKMWRQIWKSLPIMCTRPMAWVITILKQLRHLYWEITTGNFHQRVKNLNHKRLGVSTPNLPMIVAYWKMRGLDSPLNHRPLASFLSSHNVFVATLIETKLNLVNALTKKNFTDWDYAQNLEHCSKSRIVAMWRMDRISLDVLLATSKLLHCQI